MLRIFKSKEVAKHLGTHVKTVRSLARCRIIPAFKVCKDWRFESTLKQWAKKHYIRYRISYVPVEDNDETALKHILQIPILEEYNISIVSNGRQVLEFIQRDTSGVAIIDFNILELNEPYICSKIRRL